MAQKNSFISLMENVANLNKQSVEILTKLNDVVSTTKNSIDVNYTNTDGSTSTFSLPSVGYLQNQIALANSNIKKLTTLEGDNSVIIVDNNSSRKIKSVDLNREPDQIDSLNQVTSFQQNNNWFFESLINPSLSVELDLSSSITEGVNKILSRRYIIDFEKGTDGLLTSNGTLSKTSFENTFLNKNDFSIEEFQTWLINPTNYGVVNRTDENLYMDEQFFDLNYKVVNYKGYFSVLKLQTDNINNKVWYHLNTLSYYDRNGNTKTLAIGDLLAISSKKSYSKYKILEINTSESTFRISVERIEGYDAIPIGTSVLEFYSSLESQSTVKVTIGFDEYNVIFCKSVNTENNIICSDWSKGMAFYTNDLVLSTDKNIGMSDFYLNSVYDYGVLLKDLVAKRIPSTHGSIPNKPSLISDNFKVVQINKHLTDTKDFKTLKNLHSQKNSIKSKLSEVNDSITQKNMELNTKQFKSIAEKSRAQNEINKLISTQENQTKLYTSYVDQITNSTVEQSANPKFSLRGFWDIPLPIILAGFRPQEVIGFEVQYRYGSTLGSDNTTDGFQLISLDSSGQTVNKTAYYSAWKSIKTDIRKRTYDSATDQWIWQVEDVSDADTPNINQLDIPIQNNEKVDIRIRSISEVGYPDSPLYSDWSDVLTKEFPTELNGIISENQFIMTEATQDKVVSNFNDTLTSNGITKHVSGSYYHNEQYVAHLDKDIDTSFKDSNNNSINLFEYLKAMNDKISALEEAISRAKGELKITLFNGTQETEITSNSVINININCEDYMTISGSTNSMIRTYLNNVYLVNDYYLKFENISTENPLGIISNYRRSDFVSPSGKRLIPIDWDENAPSLMSDDGIIYNQKDFQYVWIMDSAILDGSETTLYSGITAASANVALTTDYTNIGCGLGSTQKLLDTAIWNNGNNKLGATVHPYVLSQNFTNVLVDINNQGVHILKAQNDEKIPLQVYFKPEMSSNSIYTPDTMTPPNPLKKALKFRIDLENSYRPVEFTIIFKIIRYNTVFIDQIHQSIPIAYSSIMAERKSI